MTTKHHPAAATRSLVGATTAIALIGMVTGFQTAAHAEQQAAAAAAVSAAESTVVVTTGTDGRTHAVRVLDPSLLPQPAAATTTVAASGATSSSRTTSPAAPAPAAPAPAAPAPAAPAPPADGTTAGSGG